MDSGLSCNVSSGGTLDNIMITFCDSMLKYGNEATILANKIFITLFALEFLWQLTVKKVFAGDIEKLWVFFFTRSCLGFFFAKYLVNVDVYRGIITYIAKFGARIGGFNITFSDNVSGLFAGITPSAMIGYFSCIADFIHQNTDRTGSLDYIVVKFMLALTLVLFFLVMIGIAYLLMEIFIKTYFLLYVGFILTGFAGSSWTITYWQRYLQQISAMALEFLAQCVLLGVFKTQADTWVNALASSKVELSALAAIFTNMLGVSLIFLMLMYTLPRWVGKTLAGEVRLKLDDRFTAMSSFMSGGGY